MSITGVNAAGIVYAPDPDFRPKPDGTQEIQMARKGTTDWADAFASVPADKIHLKKESSTVTPWNTDIRWKSSPISLSFEAKPGRVYLLTGRGVLQAAGPSTGTISGKMYITGAFEQRAYLDFDGNAVVVFTMIQTYIHVGTTTDTKELVIEYGNDVATDAAHKTRMSNIEFEVVEI